mgnify:CR=1 FL=1
MWRRNEIMIDGLILCVMHVLISSASAWQRIWLTDGMPSSVRRECMLTWSLRSWPVRERRTAFWIVWRRYERWWVGSDSSSFGRRNIEIPYRIRELNHPLVIMIKSFRGRMLRRFRMRKLRCRRSLAMWSTWSLHRKVLEIVRPSILADSDSSMWSRPTSIDRGCWMLFFREPKKRKTVLFVLTTRPLDAKKERIVCALFWSLTMTSVGVSPVAVAEARGMCYSTDSCG